MLNEHFHRAEFECQCGCGQCGVDVELLTALTKLRKHLNTPVHITSGNRCVSHNKIIGGAPDSKHTKGIAADFKCRDFSPREIADILEEWFPDKYGIGVYSTWVHLDVRSTKARW